MIFINGFINALLIIEVEIDFGKPFQEANFFILFISSGSKFTLQIRLALHKKKVARTLLETQGKA